MQQEVLIPRWLKEGYLNGLKGGAIPTSQQIMQYSSLELHTVLDNLEDYDLNLSNQNKADLKETASFCDELIHVSLRTNYGWGIPCEESISLIAKFIEKKEGLIELGAGSGLWSALLKARTQKNIIACEKNLRHDTPRPKYGLVLNADLEEIMPLYPDYPILIVWTDINNMGVKAIEKLKPGNHLILTGPPWVTGTDEFYKKLDEEFKIVSQSVSCTFTGGDLDSIYILEKQPSPNLENDGYFMKERIKNRINFNKKTKKIS